MNIRICSIKSMFALQARYEAARYCSADAIMQLKPRAQYHSTEVRYLDIVSVSLFQSAVYIIEKFMRVLSNQLKPFVYEHQMSRTHKCLHFSTRLKIRFRVTEIEASESSHCQIIPRFRGLTNPVPVLRF